MTDRAREILGNLEANELDVTGRPKFARHLPSNKVKAQASLFEAANDAVLDELRAMSYDERVASPCIGAERADLVLAGCAILEAIRRIFPCARLRVADRGLREGMLVQLMRADDVWAQNHGHAS